MKQHLDNLLDQIKSAAAKDKEKLANAGIMKKGMLYSWAAVKGFAEGAAHATYQAGKMLIHVLGDAAEAVKLSGQSEYHLITGNLEGLQETAKAEAKLAQEALAPLVEGIKLLKFLYKDAETRQILENFAVEYYRSESALMLTEQVSDFVGGFVPAIALAVITKNPSSFAIEVAEAGELEAAAAEAEKIAETLTELEKVKEINAAEVNKLHWISQLEDIEVNGVKPVNVHQGSDKIAVIGRSMAGEKGVRSYAKGLSELKDVEVEIFDGNTVSKSAIKEFNRLRKGAPDGKLSYNELTKTEMYEENKQWIEKIKNEGYTIVDIGNPNNQKASAFYDMEKAVLNGEK